MAKNNTPYAKAYLQKHDEFKIRPTLEEGQEIRQAAAAAGMSVQAFFLAAVREKMGKAPQE